MPTQISGTTGVSQVQDNTIDSNKILDGTITNADISSTALIDGSKIIPDFENQNIITNGSVGIGTLPVADSRLTVAGQLRIENSPGINIINARFAAFNSSAPGISPMFDIDLAGGDPTSEHIIRMFRTTNTTGNVSLGIIRGDNSTNNGANICANGTVPTYFNRYGNNFGIGTIAPDQQLSVNGNASKVSGGTWVVFSDERIKTNITLADTNQCYNIIKTLPLKRFTYRDDIFSHEQAQDRTKLGWIAQDVQPLFPKAIYTNDQTFSPTGLSADEITIKNCLTLDGDQIYATMYGAIQKLINTVEVLETRISELESK